ncbi:MAG: FKBP-type peptidyl-prolyl cis-trans isomerase [Actinomycetota bacterium]|nr:FKBP-type peptidyl-prolyl cis-trans isomerase [Actinomycetota bacterium]
MLRRLRRPAGLVLPVVLLSGLAACGSEDGLSGALEGFDAVTISGEVGSVPEVAWKGQLEAGDVESKTLVEGEGAELAEGDPVIVNYWLGNGYTEEVIQESFGEEVAGLLLTVGGEAQPPQTVDDILKAFVSQAVTEGATLGSRVALVASAEEALGVPTGLPELGIGNADSLVIVVDLLSQPLEQVEGKAVPIPPWGPDLVVTEGEPTSFDYEGAPAPNMRPRLAVLVEGTGPVVEDGDLLVANYLGQAFDAAKPFDESFSRDEPVGFPIGLRAVVKGWDKTLVGVPVGSRVFLQLPPEFGYGEQGNPQAGIKPTDTLNFVIDILAAE